MFNLKGKVALITGPTKDKLFVHEDDAMRSLIDRMDDPGFDAAACPLRPVRA